MVWNLIENYDQFDKYYVCFNWLKILTHTNFKIQAKKSPKNSKSNMDNKVFICLYMHEVASHFNICLPDLKFMF